MRLSLGFPLFFALLVSLAVSANAKPIAYAGGWSVMQMNDYYMNALHAYYAPSHKLSLGYTGEYWRDQEFQLHAIGMNNLLKRWNNPDSQGNIFLASGVGVAISDFQEFENKTEPAAYGGILADWEDRRWFFSYENRLQYAGDIDKSYRQQGRIGIAPYIGDYGSLHTWLMLQVDHNPGHEHTFVTTPLVRLFKGTVMGEAGVSQYGDFLFNLNLTF